MNWELLQQFQPAISNNYFIIISPLQVYVETSFLVCPLEYLNKTPLTSQQVPFIHGGAYPYSVPANAKAYTHYVDSVKHESLERKAALNSRRVGFDLQQWIDGLVARLVTNTKTLLLIYFTGNCNN